jgi:hypothetical protein
VRARRHRPRAARGGVCVHQDDRDQPLWRRALERTGGTIDATLLGQLVPFAVSGKADVAGGFGGGSLQLRADNVTVFASAEYLALTDASSIVGGQAGIRVGF